MASKIQTTIDKDFEIGDSDKMNYGGVDQAFTPSVDMIRPPKFRKAVYISSVVAAAGGFICGYDTGSISGILAMPIFQERFFTEENMVYLQGLLLALYLTTAALGAFFSGFFCGKLLIFSY